METKKVRAYVLLATESEKNRIAHAVHYYDTDSENWARLGFKVTKAQALDVEALRIVLDAANCHRETMDERANDPRTLDDVGARKEADALGDAIAKLETAINPGHHEQT